MATLNTIGQFFSLCKDILDVVSGVHDFRDLTELLTALSPKDVYLQSLRSVLKDEQHWLQGQPKPKHLFFEESLEEFQNELRKTGYTLEEIVLSDAVSRPEVMDRISEVLLNGSIITGIDFGEDVGPGWGKKITRNVYAVYQRSMLRKYPQVETLINSRKIKEAVDQSATATAEIGKRLTELLQITSALWTKATEETGSRTKLMKLIETSLDWRSSEPARYFRDGSPIWIDYREGRVLKASYITTAERLLQKDQILLVIGAAGSGKSVCVNYVGYKLRIDGYTVYCHRVMDSTDFFELADEISRLRAPNTVFIIEDLHRQLDAAQDFVDQLRQSQGDGLFLLSTRPYDDSQLHEGVRDSIDALPTLRLIPRRPIFAEILTAYCQSIGYTPDDADLKMVYDLCSSDLYLLSYLIRSWNHEERRLSEFDQGAFYNRVHTKRLSQFSDLSAFLALSALYQYEIPCQKDFLPALHGLASQSSIVTSGEGSNYLYLNHSSEGRLYLLVAAFFQRPPVKQYTSIEEYSRSIVRSYILSRPQNFDVVLDRLVTAREFGMLRKLTSETDFQTQLAFSLDATPEVSRTARAITAIAKVNRRAANDLASKLSIQRLADRTKTVELFGLSLLVAAMASADLSAARKLLIMIDRDRLKRLLHDCGDVREIGFAYKCLSEAAWDYAYDLASEHDSATLIGKLASEVKPVAIAYCLYGISQANSNLSNVLINDYGAEPLIARFNDERSNIGLSRIIFYLAWANRRLSIRFVRGMDADALAKRLDNEPNLQWVEECIRALLFIHRPTARAVVAALDIQRLLNKIEKERRMVTIDGILRQIHYADPRAAWDILDRISRDVLLAKISKEPSLAHIGFLLDSVSEVNQPYAERLVDNLFEKDGIPFYLEKLYKGASHTSALHMFFRGFLNSNEEAAQALVRSIEISRFVGEFREKAQILDFGQTLAAIALIDPGIAKKIVSSLDIEELRVVLQGAHSLQAVVICLAGILASDSHIAFALASAISETMISLVEKSDELSSVGSCLKVAMESNQAVGKSLLGVLETLDMQSKMTNTGSIMDIAQLVGALYSVDSATATRVLAVLKPDDIKLRIDIERDLGSLAQSVSIFGKHTPSLAKDALTSISIPKIVQKLEIEVNPRKIENSLLAIFRANPDVAKNIVNGLHPWPLKLHINKDPNINNSAKLLRALHVIQPAKSVGLLDVDSAISRFSRVQKIRRITEALLDFDQVDVRLSNLLLQTLSIPQLLARELDPVNVLEFLGAVFLIDKDVARRAVSELKRSQRRNLAKMIEEEKNPARLGWCVLILGLIGDALLLDEVLRRVSIKKVIERAKPESVWQACWLLWTLSTYDYQETALLGKTIFPAMTLTRFEAHMGEVRDALQRATMAAGIAVFRNPMLSKREIDQWRTDILAEPSLNVQRMMEYTLAAAYPNAAERLRLEANMAPRDVYLRAAVELRARLLDEPYQR